MPYKLIPDDIMNSALDCWADLPKESRGIEHIARALLYERERERERAVKLARSWGAICKSIGQFEGEGVAEDIAMVIEDGIKPE